MSQKVTKSSWPIPKFYLIFIFPFFNPAEVFVLQITGQSPVWREKLRQMTAQGLVLLLSLTWRTMRAVRCWHTHWLKKKHTHIYSHTHSLRRQSQHNHVSCSIPCPKHCVLPWGQGNTSLHTLNWFKGSLFWLFAFVEIIQPWIGVYLDRKTSESPNTTDRTT